MRRTLTIAVFVILAALLGGNLAAGAASRNDTECRKLVKGSVSTEELLAYDACRFDKLDAQVAALKPPSAPAPTASASASPSTTPSAKPSNPSAPPSPSPSSSSTASAPTTSPSPAPAFPDARTTGVPSGVQLGASGSITVTEAGTVIDGKDIKGTVLVRAKGVVIRNSRISGSGAYCVQTQNGGNVTIEDTEIIGGCENAIGFDGWTARRVEIRGTYGDGVKLGSDVLLEDSWIHDLKPAPGAHADGGQVQSGVANTVVRHNVIDLGSTPDANAALFLAPDLGPSTSGPLVVEGNKLNGGNYTVFCVDGNDGQYMIKNITVTGNRFGDTFSYGRSNVNVPIKQSGNVVDSTGSAFTL